VLLINDAVVSKFLQW